MNVSGRKLLEKRKREVIGNTNKVVWMRERKIKGKKDGENWLEKTEKNMLIENELKDDKVCTPLN